MIVYGDSRLFTGYLLSHGVSTFLGGLWIDNIRSEVTFTLPFGDSHESEETIVYNQCVSPAYQGKLYRNTI